MAENFVCKRCRLMTRNKMSVNRLNDDVETAKENALNVNGGSEKTVVARSGNRWMRI